MTPEVIDKSYLRISDDMPFPVARNRDILRRDDGVPVGVATTTKPKIVVFGTYEFNADSKELRKEGVRVRLEGQPLAILQMLLDRPGELVTREELQKNSGRGTRLSISNIA